MKELSQILSEVKLNRTDIPSQVTINERQVLKHLCRTLARPSGSVIDLGSGAGSSALAMAEGLLQRSDNYRPVMHVYDWFSIGPGHFATADFKRPDSSDDQSFLEDFRFFMAPYLSHVEIHSGDINLEKWKNESISVLHVDICKDFATFKHIAQEFFPSLKAGSVFVHQDYSRPRLPWLHFSTGIMAEVLEPLYRINGSIFYTIKSEVTPDMIAMMTSDSLTIAERIDFARAGIDQAAAAECISNQHFVCLAELTEIYIEHWFGDRVLARRQLIEAKNRAAIEKFYPELVMEIEEQKALS